MKAAGSLSGKSLYEFGPFRLDTTAPLLLRSGEVVPLAPKTLDVLVVLVDKRGTLVCRDELVSAVWPDTFVEENNLTHHISLLRKTLGNIDNVQPYIETIPKRGYRFTGSVRQTTEEVQLPDGEERLYPALHASNPPSQNQSFDQQQPSSASALTKNDQLAFARSARQ